MALLTGDEVIEIAIRLEKDGQTFYSRAAESATSPGVRALFEDLAEQELHHQHAFEKLGRDVVELALTPEQWDEFQAYASALLKQRLFSTPDGALGEASEAGDEQTALRAALGFEEETLLFFHELRGAVRGPGQQVVERIAEEEKQHIQRLTSLLAEY